MCESEGDFTALEGLLEYYKHMPIKFVVYNGMAEQKDFEAKWGIKGTPKKDATDLMQQIITANNELVKLIAGVFNGVDKDHSGFIEIHEILELAKELGQEIPPEEAEMVIAGLDSNKDKKISLEEFVEWWKTGRKGRTYKMGDLVSGWLKSNPMMQSAMDSLSKMTEEESKAPLLSSSFAVHVNKVTAPGIAFEFKFLTRSKALEGEFQSFASAVALNPKRPFFGLALGTKNPKAAREKLEELVNGGITMASAMIPPVATALGFIEYKFGETASKSVMCIKPSAAAEPMIEQILTAAAPMLAVVHPDQHVDARLVFSTDLNKLITESKPFYELLLDGIALEFAGEVNSRVSTQIHSVLNNPAISAAIPKMIKKKIFPMLQVDSWFQGARGELDFEVDQELKDMIKQTVGENPASMPLKDLKMMMGPQMKAMLEQMPPIVAELHTLFKDEVNSIELFFYFTDIAAFKLRFSLPGLDKFLALD